jgi:hypothetical protein
MPRATLEGRRVRPDLPIVMTQGLLPASCRPPCKPRMSCLMPCPRTKRSPSMQRPAYRVSQHHRRHKTPTRAATQRVSSHIGSERSICARRAARTDDQQAAQIRRLLAHMFDSSRPHSVTAVDHCHQPGDVPRTLSGRVASGTQV